MDLVNITTENIHLICMYVMISFEVPMLLHEIEDGCTLNDWFIIETGHGYHATKPDI